jgi:hypothetical protein
MLPRSYRSLTFYAGFAVVHLAVVLLLAGLAPHVSALAGLAAALPLLLAWGPYQAHLMFNPDLDELERRRWRIAMWLLPWVIALYWRRHVRVR